MSEPLHILAIAAHPDDAELLMGGTLARAAAEGKRTGILDLAGGEAGSRGSSSQRLDEAKRAAEILGVAIRENAGLPDAHIEADVESRLLIARWICRLQPELLLIHYPGGRNPDHHAASVLARQAAYSAGLSSLNDGKRGHRPRRILEAVSFLPVAPTVTVDISESFETKLDAIRAYPSQFEGSMEAGDILSNGVDNLIEQVRFRNRNYGAAVQVPYGEPYFTREPIRFENPLDIEGRSL